jgi:DNA-binding PadR family transcriptional regulator
MTNAELAILSLIVERPRHGYEIEQVIEERGMREWTEVGFSSIYYILKKLEGQGWVRSHVEVDGGRGPARRVYQVTQEGLDAWREATLQTLASPAGGSMSFLMGLNNLPGVPRQQAIAALLQQCAHLVQRRERIRSRSQEQAPLPYFVQAMFDYSLALIEAQLGWVERFIQQLERMPTREQQPDRGPHPHSGA